MTKAKKYTKHRISKFDFKFKEVDREFVFPSVCALVEHYLKEKKKVQNNYLILITT